jgi:hypothetical protein
MSEYPNMPEKPISPPVAIRKEKKGKKKKVLLILGIVLVVALVGYVVYDALVLPYLNKIAQESYQLGAYQLTLEQTQTGNIYYFDEGTIKAAPLQQLCGGLQQ